MELILHALRDLPLLVKALFMGVVEGVTEFLPISSTGHLILFGALLGFDDARAKVFDLAIQTGAMVAVIWNYRERFGQILSRELPAFFGKLPSALLDRQVRLQWFSDPAWQLSRHLMIAFVPAAVLGLLFGSWIKQALFHPVPVATVLILGGLVILFVERWCLAKPQRLRIQEVSDLNNLDALKLGIAQAFALIPGTSRSGATIIGGMIFGLSRRAATEFSFFLAVPTLIAAGAYDLLRNRALIRLEDLPMFGLGLLSAYVSALVVIRWLIRWVSQHSFNGFAVYRILAGMIVLVAIYFF
ncbi:MAG: undecaprenyl-diphosphate phosphatase [Burkholderiaceae bacterium]|nr:undecaprenyl-diphosphate phosphatase [Burkholderiaceae bacterium]